MGPPGPSYIGTDGKLLSENLKKKSTTLEDSGNRIRIKIIDIIFRSLTIIFYSFHPVLDSILVNFANSYAKSRRFLFRAYQ
jgi:hypothetical protein